MKYHCGVCLYIYNWLGFSLKSNECPVLLRAKASGKAPWKNYSKCQRPVREGSQSELFSPDLMLASRHRSWSKMRTQFVQSTKMGRFGPYGPSAKQKGHSFECPFCFAGEL